MTEIIHKELSYQLVGCIFDVHNEVGPGVREECYQKAMEHRLRDGRIPFIAKPATRCELIYRGEVVDIFEPDFVVAEKMILELKHQVEGFVPENESQVLNYLSEEKVSANQISAFHPETVPDTNGTVVIVSDFRCSVYAIRL